MVFDLVYQLPWAALRRTIVELTPIASVQKIKKIIEIQDRQVG
jgi:hypothetical protein